MSSNGSPDLSEIARKLGQPFPEPLPDPQSLMGSLLTGEACQILFAQRMTREQRQAVQRDVLSLRKTIDAISKPIFKATGKVPPHLIGAMGAIDDALRLLRQSRDTI